MDKYLIEGAVLNTLDGTKLSNAIITKITKDNLYIVITDFGNMLRFTKEEIYELYQISPKWIEAISFDYPMPSIEERIKQQILNLEESLNLYKNKDIL